jgi:hypothetical protein
MESLVSDITVRDRKTANLFFTVHRMRRKTKTGKRQVALCLYTDEGEQLKQCKISTSTPSSLNIFLLTALTLFATVPVTEREERLRQGKGR